MIMAPYDIETKQPMLRDGSFKVESVVFSPHPDDSSKTIHQVICIEDTTSGLAYWNKNMFVFMKSWGCDQVHKFINSD